MTTTATPTEIWAGTTSPRRLALKAVGLYEATCFRMNTWGDTTPDRCLNGAARKSEKAKARLSGLPLPSAVADRSFSNRGGC